jgi:hypothetical protein
MLDDRCPGSRGKVLADGQSTARVQLVRIRVITDGPGRWMFWMRGDGGRARLSVALARSCVGIDDNSLLSALGLAAIRGRTLQSV